MADRVSVEAVAEVLRIGTDGRLYWKPRSPHQFTAQFPERACQIWNSRHAGKPAFTTHDEKGYARGSIFGRKHLAHRVIWALTTGRWPQEAIDHIDGNPANNRIDNLREATKAENAQNIARSRRNTSGFTGVAYIKRRDKWQAIITVDGRHHFLGEFKTKEEAAQAYANGKARLHKFQPIERAA